MLYLTLQSLTVIVAPELIFKNLHSAHRMVLRTNSCIFRIHH